VSWGCPERPDPGSRDTPSRTAKPGSGPDVRIGPGSGDPGESIPGRQEPRFPTPPVRGVPGVPEPGSGGSLGPGTRFRGILGDPAGTCRNRPEPSGTVPNRSKPARNPLVLVRFDPPFPEVLREGVPEPVSTLFRGSKRPIRTGSQALRNPLPKSLPDPRT
jgi:hypothetical protein